MYFLRLAHHRASSSRRYLTPLPPSNVAFSALNLSLGLVANGGAANLGGSRPFKAASRARRPVPAEHQHVPFSRGGRSRSGVDTSEGLG
jgi:hypothetical protein